MSNLRIRMLHEAQVKEGPAGFSYDHHWNYSKDAKTHKSLYKHINQAVRCLLNLPIVSVRQLKPQLRNNDYHRQSILKSSTCGYNGKVLLTANIKNVSHNQLCYTHSFLTHLQGSYFTRTIVSIRSSECMVSISKAILHKEHSYVRID